LASVVGNQGVEETSSEQGCDVVGVCDAVESASAESLSCGSGKGYFSGCAGGVQRELRETRAQRYIAENRLRAAEAAEKAERLRLERATRLGEARFELKRQRVEVQLNNLREKRLGAVTTGWVESVVSGVEEPVAGTPSMSVGSVSPSSSMSVEQEKKLMCALNTMSVRIKELEAKLAVFTGKESRGVVDDGEECQNWSGSMDDYMQLKAVEAQDLQEALDRDVY